MSASRESSPSASSSVGLHLYGEGSLQSDDTPEKDAECRVCRCGSEVGVLYYPCRCKGSIRYVHEDCLVEWLTISQKTSCEVCKAEFRFRQIYRGNTPTRLGSLEVLFGSFELLLESFPVFARYIGVILIWMILMPYLIERIHLLLFATSLEEASEIFFATFSMLVGYPGKMFLHCSQGFMVQLLVVSSVLGIATLQEKINRLETPRFRRERGGNFEINQQRLDFQARPEEGIQENIPNDEPPRVALDAVPDLVMNFQNDGRIDVLLGEAGLIQGVKNMIFVCLFNAVFLVAFQFIPFQTGRLTWLALFWHKSLENPYIIMILGYAVSIFLLSVYLLCSFILKVENQHHIRYIKHWFVQLSFSVFSGIRLLIISFIEFVLLEQVVGVVTHIAVLEVFQDSDPYERFHMCLEMPKTCIGIHWLVGTLIMTAVSILVQSLYRVLRPRWVKMLTQVLLFKASVRDIKLDIAHNLEAPFPSEREELLVDGGALIMRDVIVSKSLYECLQYTFSLLLFSVPLAILMLVLPVRILRSLTTAFPLRLGMLEAPFTDVQVTLDIFLMHTAVPYILDSVQLSLIFTYFMRMVAFALAYPLDLHGLLLSWKNYFSVDHDSEYIKVTLEEEKILSKVEENSGRKKDIISFTEISRLPPYSRLDLVCVACGCTPRLTLNKIFRDFENGVDAFFSQMNPIPLFAVTDAHGYAVPVFLSNCKIKGGLRSTVARMLFTTEYDDPEPLHAFESEGDAEIEHVLIEKAKLFLIELSLVKGADYVKEAQAIVHKEGMSIAKKLTVLFSMLTIEERSRFCRRLPLGFGSHWCGGKDNVKLVRRITRILQEGNRSSNIITVAFKNAMVSSCQGRSLVLDFSSEILVLPSDYEAKSVLENDFQVQDLNIMVENRQRKAKDNSEGQFFILQHSPSFLRFRFFIFVFLSAASAMFLSMLSMFIPLLLGRSLFAMLYIPFQHDLYHWTTGCLIVWGSGKLLHWCLRRLVKDRSILAMVRGVIRWTRTMLANVLCVFVMFIAIPFSCGVLFELSFLFPLRYPIDKTPVVSIVQNWALGLALIKLWSRLIEIGVFGDSPWVQKVESLQNIRGLDRMWLLHQVAVPVLSQLLLRLSLPYFMGRLIGALTTDLRVREVILRLSFPIVSALFFCVDLISLLFIWLDKLHDRIRDQRYLVGRKLENFKHKISEINYYS